MKKKELETTSLEERKVGGVWTLATAALVWALSLLSPSEWSAKTKSDMPEGVKVTEVTQQKQEMDATKVIHLSDLWTWSWTWIRSGEDDPIKFEPDPDLDVAKTIKVKVGDKVEAEDLVDLSKYPEWAAAEFVEWYELDTTHASKWVETVILVSTPGEIVEMVVVKVDVEDAEWHEGLEVHGFVQVGTSVVPDFAGIFSDKASGLMCISAWDQKTWLWVSLIRLDDFSSDPAYPVSRATVIVPSWSKSIWEWWSFETWLECTYMDKLPWEKEFLPYVVWSYKTKSWWTIEWKYFHQFKEWPDMAAFRLWITKQITDALSLTGHWWYKSDYAKHFYWRIIVDVKLWWGFWAQMSGIYKDWTFTPTRWVMYKF